MLRLFKRSNYRSRDRITLTRLDERTLRDLGLNPDDFREPAQSLAQSLLFTPFRDSTRR